MFKNRSGLCNISRDLRLFTPPGKVPHIPLSQPDEGNRQHIQPASCRELSCGIKYHEEHVSLCGRAGSYQHAILSEAPCSLALGWGGSLALLSNRSCSQWASQVEESNQGTGGLDVRSK